MSTPVRRTRVDRSSLGDVRGLLERNLLERAVTLSESRWPGSGALVRLAHDWGSLSAGERRQRLATIGPEDLARLREVADLQPDLARVLDDLEARGILPPAVADDAAPSTIPEPLASEERVAAVLDLAQEQAAELIESVEAATGVTPSPAEVRQAVRTWSRSEQIRPSLTPLPQVLNPRFTPTDSASQFQELEAERRAQVVHQAENILDRVRRTLDSSAERLAEPRLPVLPGDHERVPERKPRHDGVPAGTPAVDVVVGQEMAPVEEEPQTTSAHGTDWLAQALRQERVLVADAEDGSPASHDLHAAAAALGLTLVELATDDVPARELYGGLTRSGRQVVARAGRLPQALAGHNLVVLRGRLLPKFLDRLRAGYFDIPGTSATVRMASEARLVVLPE
jgi:hypothetical protein